MTQLNASAMPSVAVIGSGYWGKNLVRTFFELGALACVCDARREVLNEVASKYRTRVCTECAEVLKDQAVQTVVIAAPAAQHYQMARQAMLSGKDVYVEKPLALRASGGAGIGAAGYSARPHSYGRPHPSAA